MAQRTTTNLSPEVGRTVPMHRQRGMTMLEALVVLALGALAVVGAVKLMAGGFRTAGSTDLISDVNSIRIGTKQLFYGQPAGSYGTASLNVTLKSVFPTSLSYNAGTVTDQWNGGVVVTGATTQFTISYASVPDDVCTSAVAGTGSVNEFPSIKINGGAARTPPVNPTQAASDCSNGSNTIVWTANG